MNMKESLESLYVRTKPKENLTVEELNRRARERADKEELAHMEFLKRLNAENRRNRTGGWKRDIQN